MTAGLRRLAPYLALVALLALVRPVIASEPVVVDPAGDATPERCEPVVATCHRLVSGESQPAADIIAVEVVPHGNEFGIEITFLDIDRPIPNFASANGVLNTWVSFRLGGRDDNRWASVWLSTTRDFSGALTSPNASVTIGTVGGNDNELSRDLPGSAFVDPASNRLRISTSLDDLQRAVSEMCPGCGSLTKGSKLWSFFADSAAHSYVGSGFTAVGVEAVAHDTGWPDDRSYTM